MNIDIEIDILSQLMPNVLTVLSQLCATGVLFFLMYKLAYKPVMKIIDARSEYEQQKLEKYDELIKENEEINQNEKAIIDNANAKAKEILSQATVQGNQMKEQLIEEGKQKAQSILSDANETLASQKSKMMAEMHDEMVEIAFSAAEKMVESKLDEKKDKQSISDFIKDIENK